MTDVLERSGSRDAGVLGVRIGAILRRRSYRSFRPDPLPHEVLAALRAVAAAAPSVEGLRSGRATLVDDADVVARLPAAVTAGVVGKINLWLRRSPPPAFLIVAGDSACGLRDGDRHYYNVDGAIAGQAAVIEAAGRGVGSCWMAGFHERSVAEAVRLPEGNRPLAVIALGYPRVRSDSGSALFATGWDALTQRLVSRRRKPLAQIAFRGRFGAPFEAAMALPAADRGVEAAGTEAWPGVGPLRSASGFADAPVPAAALAALLECARWAPSADNSQIARHVVVEGTDAVERLLRVAFPDASSGAFECPPAVAIVSLAAPFILKARTREQPFALIDAPIAVTNMLAACGDLGLGWQVAVRFDHRSVAAHVGAPEDHPAIAITGIGRAAGDASARGITAPLDQLRSGVRARYRQRISAGPGLARGRKGAPARAAAW